VTLDLILPWFPIVLAVGVGARLLDRTRGVGFGILGAVFWLAVVLGGEGVGQLANVWVLTSLLAGAVAIIAVGAWSGGDVAPPVVQRPVAAAETPERPDRSRRVAGIAEALRRFDAWLEAHRYWSDPWPEFGELVRSLLFDLCGARGVRPYRILSEDDQMVPLRALRPGDVPDVVSARQGIVGHVATSGTSYLAGDPSHGELIDHLAEDSDEGMAWCFAVQRGPDKIGLVKVAGIDDDKRHDTAYLDPRDCSPARLSWRRPTALCLVHTRMANRWRWWSWRSRGCGA